jgi:hypothetical protein
MPATDTNNYLTTIGIVVKVNSVAVKGATEFSDLGASPNMLDATKLTDTVKVNKPGVQELPAWVVTYLFNNNESTSDFRVLQALADAGAAVPVEVDFPDGTKFTNTGIPTNYAVGGQVNQMQTAKCEFALQGAWTVTNPTGATS